MTWLLRLLKRRRLRWLSRQRRITSEAPQPATPRNGIKDRAARLEQMAKKQEEAAQELALLRQQVQLLRRDLGAQGQRPGRA